MPATGSTSQDQAKSALEEFLRRANKANIHTEEASSNDRAEAWEVLDEEKVKKVAEDEKDKEEWVLIGETVDDV